MALNQDTISDQADIMQWIFKRNGYPAQNEINFVTDNPPEEFDEEEEEDHDFDWE